MARCNVEALNRALQEVPVEQVRVHVCWGNYAGPHHQEIDGPGVSGDVMKMVDAGRCRKMQGDAGRCRKMQGDVGRCREMQADAGRCRKIQERCREM